jgi:hypothetical protein
MKLLRAQYRKLSPQQLLLVSGGLTWLRQNRAGTLDMVTGCSGTDVRVGCVHALVQFWEDMFGLSFHVRHRIACESVEYKSTFVIEYWSLEHLFPDLLELGGAVAREACDDIQTIHFVATWSCVMSAIRFRNCRRARLRTALVWMLGRAGRAQRPRAT